MKRLFVFLHGFLGQPGDWQETVGAMNLGQDDEVWCPNLFSQESLADLSPKNDFRKWSVEFNQEVAKRTADKNYLVGYSLGGRLALHAIISGPRLWDGAAIVSANPGLLSEEEFDQREKTDLIWANKFRSGDWSETVGEWQKQSVLESSQPIDRQEQDFDRELLSLALTNWSVTRHQLTAFDLVRLGVPTLWLAGEKDERYVHIYKELASQSVPGEYKKVSGAAHRVFSDQPAELARLICENVEFVL